MGRAAVGIEIRRAVPGDADAIAAVLRRAFAEFQPLYSPNGFAATVVGSSAIVSRLHEGPIWVAIADRHIVGTGAAVKKATGAYVRGMAVMSALRGAGIGRLLLQEAESFAVRCNARRLFLSTTPFLVDAIRLYRRFGFTPTSEGPRDLFGTPLVTMEKVLTLR